MTLVDIEKFFDSESLRGVMNTLHMAGVHKKAYRNLYNLNNKTVSVVSVKTDAPLMCEFCICEWRQLVIILQHSERK